MYNMYMNRAIVLSNYGKKKIVYIHLIFVYIII